MSSTVVTQQRPLGFIGLHTEFTKVLQEAFQKQDAHILRASYESFGANTDHDKKSPMDQAFREMLLFRLSDEVEKVGALVRLSVEAVRAEIVSVTIPVVLLGDIFDAVTLDKCEQIFRFVEEMVEVWKEDIFFSSCKNNILRMCNDLLRRLSRAQNTVFCGRILLFLSKFFPFSERSGLNIVSEFNLDNVTEYGVDGKDLDDTVEDTVEDIPIKIDYNLYCKFWSLQDFFRNPNQCYSKAQWKMFQAHAGTVLEAFDSFKLEEPRVNSAGEKTENALTAADYLESMKMDLDASEFAAEVDNPSCSEVNSQNVRQSDHFFAKFLTNPKLLTLQLSDSNFRRSVLVQFLILFQYLQLTVKFKTESNTLTTAQTDFIKETEAKVYKLLEDTPPNGKRFSRTVRHMLTREEMWNNWKNDGCKEFRKPDDAEPETTANKDAGSSDVISTKPPAAKRAKRTLGDSLKDAHRNSKFFLGNDVLTRLWNYSPDNLQACKSEERNFLPNVETFLENPHEKNDPSFEWRALRLLARQSPHFFTFLNSPSYKIADYLEGVRRRLAKDRLDNAKAALNANNVTSVGGNSNTESVIAGESNSEQGSNPQEAEGETDVVGVGDGDNDGDGEGDGDAMLTEEDVQGDLDKGDDDRNAHTKPVTATREQIEEIAPLIGDDWKKLGKKLGYTVDELLYFETEHPDRDGGCIAMLSNWFADDDDASLDNWAYMLEGLEINAAAKAVKALIDRLTPKDDKVEVLSD
ncbi:LOW QUALITY PROTEIN: THO complex subunit 1-like [Rhagoletis pomonella]|uniref:LOW QUALITY PROTEIN: THO complex subunit 1-like n=1 Tax=Rhagoletis pomonella TaxID=28610 RepID=UPI001786FA34|nr:LOW QUALITY PROTEIN: THO complex subunit 1-like [Rhagoletis pomonella]